MKPFFFRLQSLLNYRVYMQKKAGQELSKARNAHKQTQRHIQALIDKEEKTAKKCRKEGINGMPVPLYQVYRSFLDKLESDLQQANCELRKADEDVRRKEAFLTMESVRKKILERLKDLRFQDYAQKSRREEQKVMDELVVIRRGRGL